MSEKAWRWFIATTMILFIVLGTMVAITESSTANASEPSVSSSNNSDYDGNDEHCVTPREVWIVGKYLTRDQLEKRWEMRGRGKHVFILGYGRAWIYPMCDPVPGYNRWGMGSWKKHRMAVGIYKMSDNQPSFRMAG